MTNLNFDINLKIEIYILKISKIQNSTFVRNMEIKSQGRLDIFGSTCNL